MTATPTREELVARVEHKRELYRLALSGHGPRAIREEELRSATEDLNAHDAADLALVRKLLDEHCVMWEWTKKTGTYYCHLYSGSCNEEPCGTGATRSEALVDLARKVAATDGSEKR